MTSSACFACTKALSETIAGLPGVVYRGLPDNTKQADMAQPAWNLLVDQPNPEMDSFTFWELVATRVINAGNFFAEIQRDNADRPIALWPIHPSRVKPMRDTNDKSLYWQIESDYSGSPEYDDPSWRKQHLRFLGSHDMLNIVGFGSTNGIISPGILPGAQEIGVDFAARRYGSEFFSKGAVPSGIVEHPGWIAKDDVRRQFRDDINKIHSNATNAHSMGVLWEGAKYNQISVAPEQAQFLETRRYTTHQICSLYGVPPAIIGDYTDNKFATADAMIRAFVMMTLRNLVIRIEKAVYRQVLNVTTEDGRLRRAFSKPVVYKMALDGLLRGDPKTQAETMKIYRDAGVYSANQILGHLDQNPIEGPEGEYRLIPGGFQRLDQVNNQQDTEGSAEVSTSPDGADDASLPQFDRASLAAAIMESGLTEEPKTQVRGHSLDGTEVVRDVVVTLADDAVERIHGITKTQVERWRQQDPESVAEKLPAFWDKQQERLKDALSPCDKAITKITNSDSNASGAIAEAYAAMHRRMDSHSVFDVLSQPLVFEPKTFIEVEICCSQ